MEDPGPLRRYNASVSRRMTTAEARSWLAGWNALEERERAELRNESHQEKFAALAFLMASGGCVESVPGNRPAHYNRAHAPHPDRRN